IYLSRYIEFIMTINEVLFQGFKTFARSSPFWGMYQVSWGYTLGPWAVIGAFPILILVWFFSSRYRTGKVEWFVRSPLEVDLKSGVAPLVIRRRKLGPPL